MNKGSVIRWLGSVAIVGIIAGACAGQESAGSSTTTVEPSSTTTEVTGTTKVPAPTTTQGSTTTSSTLPPRSGWGDADPPAGRYLVADFKPKLGFEVGDGWQPAGPIGERSFSMATSAGTMHVLRLPPIKIEDTLVFLEDAGLNLGEPVTVTEAGGKGVSVTAQTGSEVVLADLVTLASGSVIAAYVVDIGDGVLATVVLEASPDSFEEFATDASGVTVTFKWGRVQAPGGRGINVG